MWCVMFLLAGVDVVRDCDALLWADVNTVLDFTCQDAFLRH